MVDFICLDGPLKNKCLRGDFHSQVVDGVEYAKSTLAMCVEQAGNHYRVILDVAHVGILPTIDWRKYRDHLVVQKEVGSNPDLDLDKLKLELSVVTRAGTLVSQRGELNG